MELPTRTILIVDDTPEDRVLFRRVLTRNSAYSYRFIETETGREALSLCGVDNLDCILLDYELPDMYGTEILKGIVAQRGANPIPVVMLSGRASLQIAVKALQHGAHDYLDKDHQRDGDDLHRAISNAIEKVRLERERRHAIEQLRESEAQMRLVLNASKVGIWIYDFDTRRTNWSPEAYDIFGRTYYGGTNEEFDRMLHPEDVEFARKIFNTAVKSHRLYQAEFRILRPDGEIRWVGNQGHAEYQADGKPRRFLGTVYDITARKRHELSLAFTAEISHDLMQSRKIDEVIQRVGAKIGHYLGLSVCTFMEIDETADKRW